MKNRPKAGSPEEAALARYSFGRRNYSGSPKNGRGSLLRPVDTVDLLLQAMLSEAMQEAKCGPDVGGKSDCRFYVVMSAKRLCGESHISRVIMSVLLGPPRLHLQVIAIRHRGYIVPVVRG